MEQKYATVENQLFDNVSSTQYPTPSGFDNPQDTSNHYVSRLNANSTVNKRAGPSLVLKVMAGDQVTASVYAWYNTATQQPNNPPSLLNDLLSSLSGGVIDNSGVNLTAAN